MIARRVDIPDHLFEAPGDVVSDHLAKFLGREKDEDGVLVPKKKRSPKRTIASSSFDRTVGETKAMMASKEWDGCGARHIVALYEVMHERVYGIAPTMSGRERYSAALMVGSFTKRAFAGDMVEVVDYFRWAWTREIQRVKRRRATGEETTSRLSIRWLLGNAILDDYRVARATSGG